MGESDGSPRGATFEHVDVNAARFYVADMTGARFEQVNMSGHADVGGPTAHC
jgi:uncharacterized protein YjbI with pentapeptide repeats